MWEQGILFGSFGISLGTRPASQHEGNLVHEVGDVHVVGIRHLRKTHKDALPAVTVSGEGAGVR